MRKLFAPLILICLMLAGCTIGTDEVLIATSKPSLSPVPTSTALSISTVALTSTPTPDPTPTPTPAPAYMPAEGAYTIAWVTDTQHYSAKFPDTYFKMTEFLFEKQEEMNLKYIVFTGDFVHNSDEVEQWRVADEAMATIDGIPNGVLAGNHDMTSSKNPYDKYEHYFGAERYEKRSWFGGSYENNRGHYDLIDIGKTEYIFVYMSFEPNRAAYKWVNNVLSEHSDRIAILCLHDYLNSDGTRSKDGEKWFSDVVSANDNVNMVLCGHRYGVYCNVTEVGDGRIVYEMMANYQAAGDFGGSGYLRLMQFDEARGEIKMITYSPSLDDYNMFDEGLILDERYYMDASAEEFTIAIPWS